MLHVVRTSELGRFESEVVAPFAAADVVRVGHSEFRGQFILKTEVASPTIRLARFQFVESVNSKHAGFRLPSSFVDVVVFERLDPEDGSVRMGWVGNDFPIRAVDQEIGRLEHGLTDQHFVS